MAFQDSLRAARSACQSFPRHPRLEDTHQWPLVGEHEPGVPLGSGHELRGGDWPPGGIPNHGQLGSLAGMIWCAGLVAEWYP
jgi:hypothetical protein